MGVGQWSPKAGGKAAERLQALREGAGF